MKKKYIAGVSAAVLLVMTGVSCSNFLSGSDLTKEIQKKVDRANAQDVNVTFAIRHNFQGKIYATSEGKCKVNDVITVSYEANPDYICEEFEALDQDTKMFVPDAVEGLNSVIENSTGVSTIYSTDIKLVKPVKNLLIRPKCVWIKDNTPPVKVDSEDFPQMFYSFAVSDEYIQHAIEEKTWKTEAGYPDSNEVRNAENNRSRCFSFKLACIEPDNEIESVVITETVIESEDGQNIGVVTEWEVKKDNLLITEADSEGMYIIEPQSSSPIEPQLLYPYPLKFKSVSDGIIQVDLHVKDSRNNVSEAFTSKNVIKDTSIRDLSEAVRYDILGSYENYDNSEPLSVEGFKNKFHVVCIDTEQFKNVSSVDGNDDGVKMYISFTQDGETKDYSSKTGIFFEYDENAENPVARIKKDEYFTLDKDLEVNITVTDRTGNKNEYIKKLKCSNKPVLLKKNGEGTFEVKWNDAFNGEETHNVCAYYTVKNGAESGVTISGLDNIQIGDADEYHVCVFSVLQSEDTLDAGEYSFNQPSEFMGFDSDSIITRETVLAKNKRNAAEMFTGVNAIPDCEIDDADGKYKLKISHLKNDGNAYYVCYGGRMWAKCEKDSGTVVFDNVPGSFLVNQSTTELDFVKIKGEEALIFNDIKVNLSGYKDLEAPIVPEAYPDENMGTGMFGGNGFYSGEGSVFWFHIVDNFKIENGYKCVIFYTTETEELTVDQIKKLPYKEVAVPDEEDLCPYGIYANYSHTRISVDCADLDNGNYAFYIWLKDLDGNESITRKNAGFFTLSDKGMIFKDPDDATGMKFKTNYIGDKAFVSIESLNYDEKQSKWVTVQEYYDFREIYMKDEDMPSVIPNNFVKIILSAADTPYFDARDIFDYAYPFYYFSSKESETGRMKTYEYDGDILLVYADYPVLVETLCTEKELGEDPDYWSRHTFMENRFNTKVLHPAEEGKVSMMAYEVETSRIKEGYFYTVVMHFADGTSKIAEIKRK